MVLKTNYWEICWYCSVRDYCHNKYMTFECKTQKQTSASLRLIILFWEMNITVEVWQTAADLAQKKMNFEVKAVNPDSLIGWRLESERVVESAVEWFNVFRTWYTDVTLQSASAEVLIYRFSSLIFRWDGTRLMTGTVGVCTFWLLVKGTSLKWSVSL